MTRRIAIEIAGDSRGAERAFKRAGAAGDKFSRKLAGLSKKGLVGGRTKGLLKGVGVGGAFGGAGLAGGALFGGISSAKAAAGFEKTMARITGLAGQSQQQVAAWSNQLLSLAPTLGKGPTELAEALYFVASSGVPASKAIDVVTVSAKAAAAGLGETQVVADAVTSVMNAYGAKTMSAAHATDILVATVREGKGEADQFAGVIGNVAAFASRLKVPFEEVGAALAAMTQLGTDPATAATQLQAFFSQVIRPSAVAIKAAEAVGFSFADLASTLQTKGLLPALNMIKDAFRGNASAMAQVFPNIRALRALLALTADDGGKVAGIFNRMGKSTGSMGKAWGAAQKTAELNMNRFKASIEVLRIAFGQGLLPMVTKVSRALATKLADPAFVAKVRELGVLVGTNLYKAFAAIGTWFQENWPAIKQGFIDFGEFVKKYVIPPLRTVMKVLQKTVELARAFKEGRDKVKKRIYGGSVFSGTQEDFNKLPPEIKKRFREKGFKPTPPRLPRKLAPGTHSGDRALGGPAFAGMTYRVGERGPEMLTMGASSGHISANGGGGGVLVTGDITLQLDKSTVARITLKELQRIANTGAASRRNRYGGANLGLG